MREKVMTGFMLACGVAVAASVTSADASSYKQLYVFQGGIDGASPAAGLIIIGKTLYGTTVNGGVYQKGTVFTIDSISGAERVLHAFQAGRDGGASSANLIRVGAALYGTASSGGVYDAGVIFKVNPKTGAEKVTHYFTGGSSDGGSPDAALIDVSGLLYGTGRQPVQAHRATARFSRLIQQRAANKSCIPSPKVTVSIPLPV